MAAVTTELKVAVKVAGEAGLDKLSRSLINIGKQSKVSSTDLGKISAELRKVQQGSSRSISSLRSYRNAWRDIAEQVEIGSKEFREATAEAAKLDKQLQKTQQRRASGGGRLRAGAQIAGTVAGAGVFGGPEGALGALGGALLGGTGGAVVGGAIGAQIGQLRQGAAAAAAYSANLQKLRIALFGVTTSQQEYLEALDLINRATTNFAIPQEIVTKQFTRLQASVQGAGGDIEDTKIAFNGIVAAVRATGGSLADVDSALTATAQVFSKGKVSAEELRQQIGERLPGAFTLFAESMGKTPQELDKALEQGKVSLQDFQRFAQSLFERYGETAQIIATGPQSAGDRLAVALGKMNESVGRLLEPIGASFQDTFTEIIKLIDTAARRLNNFFGIGVEGLDKKVKDLASQLSKVDRELRETPTPQGIFAERDEQGNLKILTRYASLEQQQKRLRQQLLSAQDQLNIAIEESEFSSIRQQARGSGLSGLTDGGGAGVDGKLKDITRERLELTRQIIQARSDGQGFLVAELQYARTLLDIEQAKLGPNKKLEMQDLAREALQRRQIQLAKDAGQAMAEMIIEDEKRLDRFKKAIDDFNKSLAEMVPALTPLEQLAKDIGQAITASIAGAIEATIFQAQTLQQSLTNILRSVASLLINFGTKSLLGGLFPSAYGNVVEQNKIVPFARGGLVDKPTLFPMANGMGLMGEAGPEAIMPLRRDSSGRLGVEASGGGVTVGAINITVENTGDQLNPAAQKQIAGQVQGLVLSTLANERRSGGMLG